jgi:hypothetical protein
MTIVHYSHNIHMYAKTHFKTDRMKLNEGGRDGGAILSF